MTPEKIKYRINYFFEDFEKQNNFKSLSAKKSEQKITFSQYASIITTFLTIYFYEVFFIEKAYYFFLGGSFKRAKVTSFINNANVIIPETISAVWFDRPCKILNYRCRINYINGADKRITKIRHEFAENNTFENIISVKAFQKQCIEQQIMISS